MHGPMDVKFVLTSLKILQNLIFGGKSKSFAFKGPKLGPAASVFLVPPSAARYETNRTYFAPHTAVC